MTKEEFINKVKVEGHFGTKKEAAEVVATVFNVLSGALEAHDRFMLPGFGTFSTVEKPAREVRNPRTGKKMKTEKKTVVKFKAGRELAEKVNR